MSRHKQREPENFSRILEKAKWVFGDAEIAKRWMQSKLPCFEYRTATEILKSEPEGEKWVFTILGRIEAGTF